MLTAAIFIRIIASWIAVDPRNPFMAFLYDITEPILGPLRQIIPRFGMFDFSPMVAIILINLVARFASQALT